MTLRKKIKFIFLFTNMIMAVAAYAVAADTLVDSIKNGTLGGEAKIWYQTDDNDANERIFHKKNSWFDAGLRLGYITDAYKGFKAGVTFYAVDDLSAYKTWANSSMMNVDHSDVATWLGEAYLSYEIGKTFAKLGRQNINSPLVNSDAWALFPNNFEGVLMKSSDLPDTTLTAGYVWEERWLKDPDQEFNDFYDGVAMLGVVNKSIKDTELSAYLYYVDNDVIHGTEGIIGGTALNDRSWDTIGTYFEAKTKIEMFCLGFQYIRIDPDRSGFDATDAVAAKIDTKLSMVDVSLAYSFVTDGTLPAAKFSDHRIKTPIYTKTIAGDGDIASRPDTKSLRASVGLSPVDKLNLTAGYAYYSMDSSKYYTTTCDGDCSQAEIACKYTGIKNITLWAALWYSDHEGIGVYNGLNDDDMITFRCWASFMF